MVGVSSFGAGVSVVCNGWVVLTISEEHKTCVWIGGMVTVAELPLQGACTEGRGVAMTACAA